MSIDYRELGNTGINISPIGLGVMQFAGGKGVFKAMFPAITEADRNKIIQSAFDGGINWFDTAEMYGGGQSEKYLAESLQAAGAEDNEVIIATKWSPFFRFASNITKTIQIRLEKLAPFQIDLYQIHNPWSFSPPEKEMEMMAELVNKGHIRSVGVSNFDPDRMRRAFSTLESYEIPLASNQVHYNLLNRQIETNGVLDAAKDLGMTIIAWSPLESGLLTGKFHKDPKYLARTPAVRRKRLEKQLADSQPVIDVLNDLAEKHNSEPAQVALSWVINNQGDLVVAIPGATRVGHVEESVGAMNLQLSTEDLTRLDQVSLGYRGE
jgi:aryl-alcohol dehydrogenase-like predicted oxidoreductase